MNWPNPQEYNEAIQNPAVCFADAELRSAQVEVSAIGLPRPSTGAFASVYRLNGSGSSWAVRCFHNEVPDLKERYQVILDVLDRLKPTWAPPMQYIEKGIKLQGRWLPLIKMQWLEGLTLDRFLARHGKNSSKVKLIARRLHEILEEMRAAGIAHGDLQHGNILVCEEDVKLIDFDGMYAPGLKGMKSAELGHANYQHPYRSREHFGSYIDNFSAWLIQISLNSLSADPDLLAWGEDRECLLFAHRDLLNPYESPVFAQLKEHSIAQIRQSAQTLIHLLRAPVEYIPFLDASQEDLLKLPELDPGEQIRLIEEIASTDAVRFAEKPAVLSAIVNLESKKRGARDRLSSFLKQASSKGEAMLSSMLSHVQSADNLSIKGDSLYASGFYKEAMNAYSKALEMVAKTCSKHDPAFGARIESIEEKKFENHLNLRLANCCLLSNNPAASVVYFKATFQKTNNPAPDSLYAAAGLMTAYCQMGRFNDAQALLEDKYLLQDLSWALLNNANGPLCTVPGIGAALRFLAEHFQNQKQYSNAASIYEAVRSMGASQRLTSGADSNADILLRLGHCYLFGRRPELAIRSFKQIVRLQDDVDSSEEAARNQVTDEMHDRALIGLAVAFKMMNSSQDVVKALRFCKPERIYNGMKRELEGPLSSLDEFGQVACAFINELGEADLIGGVHLATRLAADSFRKADDKRRADQITELLKKGAFKEALAIADDELVAEYKLKDLFAGCASGHTKELVAAGEYKEAFQLVEDYKLSKDTVISAMEGKVLECLRSAARQSWNSDDFKRANVVLKELCGRGLLSEEIRRFLVQTACQCHDRTDEFISDVRSIADMIESQVPEGSSHPYVLKLRKFVLNLETPPPVAPELPDLRLKENNAGALSKKLHKRTQAASVPANTRQMEVETLDALSKASHSQWQIADLEKFLALVEAMKARRGLTGKFCETLATSLFNHFNEGSGLNRWNKEAKTQLSENHRTQIRDSLTKLMDIFAATPRIESGTLRKLKKCMDMV